MFFTSIKDNYSNALPLFSWASCFSHVGEDDEAEMDDGKMTFYCPLSVWVAAHPAKKKEHQGLWVLSSVFGPGSSSLRTSEEGSGGVSVIKCFQSWTCPSETQVTVHSSSSCWQKERGVFILTCTKMSKVRQARVDSQKHCRAAQIFQHMEVAVE